MLISGMNEMTGVDVCYYATEIKSLMHDIIEQLDARDVDAVVASTQRAKQVVTRLNNVAEKLDD